MADITRGGYVGKLRIVQGSGDVEATAIAISVHRMRVGESDMSAMEISACSFTVYCA